MTHACEPPLNKSSFQQAKLMKIKFKTEHQWVLVQRIILQLLNVCANMLRCVSVYVHVC